LGREQDFETALATLYEIKKYPVGDKIKIVNEISNIYMAKADSDIKALNYLEAVNNLNLAVQNSPEKKEIADQKLKSVASVFIEQGNTEVKNVILMKRSKITKKLIKSYLIIH